MLVILVPVLHRPHRVEPLLESIAAVTPDPYRVLFICTDGDHAQTEAVKAAGAEHISIPWGRGDYARKINTGYRHSTEPLLFLGADDLRFHPGWFEAACAAITRNPGVGVVGTNDLGNPRVLRGVHATHSLVTRDYADTYGTIDKPGMIYHEGYWHEFCDDELVETAWKREAWAFARDSIVEHLHPSWGKAPMDTLYSQQARRQRQGKRLFLERRHLWTPNNGPRSAVV